MKTINLTLLLFLGLLFIEAKAQVMMFSGTDINESQLAGVIVSIKELNVGNETPEEIVNALGKPSERTRQAGVEDWKYNFLVKNDKDSEDLNKIEQAISIRNERRSQMSFDEKISESRLNDDKYNKLRNMQMGLMEKPPIQVNCLLKIGREGKLSSVRVEKIQADGTEVLYLKGDSENSMGAVESPEPGILPSKDAAPTNPKLGQTYLNTTDTHFYGWNGKEWKQLDK
jgi:hypothetical protein